MYIRSEGAHLIFKGSNRKTFIHFILYKATQRVFSITLIRFIAMFVHWAPGQNKDWWRPLGKKSSEERGGGMKITFSVKYKCYLSMQVDCVSIAVD